MGDNGTTSVLDYILTVKSWLVPDLLEQLPSDAAVLKLKLTDDERTHTHRHEHSARKDITKKIILLLLSAGVDRSSGMEKFNSVNIIRNYVSSCDETAECLQRWSDVSRRNGFSFINGSQVTSDLGGNLLDRFTNLRRLGFFATICLKWKTSVISLRF